MTHSYDLRPQEADSTLNYQKTPASQSLNKYIPNKNLRINLDIARCMIHGGSVNIDEQEYIVSDDWDVSLAIDGIVGTGKSSMALEIARYLGVDFKITHMCFNADHFKELVEADLPRGTCIIFDESISGLFNRRSLSRENTSIVELLTKCRFKGYVLLYCIPSFLDLDKNLVLQRLRGVVHITTRNVTASKRAAGQLLKRGYFEFYGPEALLSLWLRNRSDKSYNYNLVPADFSGSYPSLKAVDSSLWSDYLEYKRQNTFKVKEEDKPKTLEYAEIEHLVYK